MAVERIVLEDHGHVSVLGGRGGDIPTVEIELAGADVLKAGNHAKRGRLAAAGGADQNDKLTVLDLQVKIVNSLDVVVIDFFDMF